MQLAAARKYFRCETDSTADELQEVTKRVGHLLRKFRKAVCSRYITKELPREVNARGRRQAALTLKKKEPETQGITKKKAAREVNFNFTTYKGHALADYAYYVRFLGTTDNYSKQTVCSIPRIYLPLFYFLTGRA